MSFIDEVIGFSMDTWEDSLDSDFVRGIADGTLDEKTFKHYIIQDTLYLKEYARVFSIAMYRAKSLEEMKVYYGLMSFVNDSEDARRLDYLKEFGITQAEVEAVLPKRATKEYYEFMLKMGEEGDTAEILMATLPCTLGYYWIFTNLVNRNPQIKDGKYWEFAKDYITDAYGSSCQLWKEYVNKICDGISIERKEHLKQIFKEGSLHELDFWRMSNTPD